MVGLQRDFLANPLGVVRSTFEQAAAALSPDVDPVAAFRGKDWGAIDLFREFLFDNGGLSQVPILDSASLRWIQPNSLVRFRGMVQDILGNELYVGAFKDGSKWRTNKLTDMAFYPIPTAHETRLWERSLLHCVPVPGQNSWTMETETRPPEYDRNMLRSCTEQQGGKRQRDVEVDDMETNVMHKDGESPSCSKRQKEDKHEFQQSQSLQTAEATQDSLLERGNYVHDLESATLTCLAKVYDMPESFVKLNEVYEFIGIYCFDSELSGSRDETDDLMDDFMEDVLVHLPPSKVPRLHCLICRKLVIQDFLSISRPIEPPPNAVRGIRESLLKHLTILLGNDELAAQCVLLHLLSRLRARVDVVAVGKLSLNLTGFTRESASIFGNLLTEAIKNLLPFSQAIPLTLEYLNSGTLQPKKDNKTGRLVTGVLQLAQGTHLTFDETPLQTGKLDSNGVENVRLLKHLMEWQKVEYDFEYYKLEMPADVQILIFSEAKSNILPADLVVPFRPSAINSQVNTSPEELEAWRWYLATLTSLPHFSEPETQQILQDEMVSSMREDRSLGCIDLNRLLTMAQLVSASFGETKFSLEHWELVKELERLRKERSN